MIEVFVPVTGYEGLYEISNLGRVKSLAKFKGTNYKQRIGERIMKGKPNTNGYLQIGLSIDGEKTYPFVHRLVAIHFIENPNNSPEVNHKNGNRICNEASNLEWCTRLENEQHSWRTGLKQMRGDLHKLSKRVLQLDLSGTLLKDWTNGYEVMNTLGYAHGHISKCCRGLAKSAYGFKWQYK
jgi:hypothetical protein